MTLQENNTHIAIEDHNMIKIYIKGINKDATAPDGSPLFTEQDFIDYPHWFYNEHIESLPLDQEDDLFAIFELLDENNRIHLDDFAIEASHNF